MDYTAKSVILPLVENEIYCQNHRFCLQNTYNSAWFAPHYMHELLCFIKIKIIKMCITSSRSILDNTFIGVWDINHKIYGFRHVLAYQNRVQNLDEGPNCMLLHIQSSKEIKPDWIIDTSKDQNFLTELFDIIVPPIPEGTQEDWMSLPKERNNFVVERGVYHIAILNNLSDSSVQETLNQIPKPKLPNIKMELISFFKENFKGFPLLLCCFDNKDAKQAAPILLHYPPIHSNNLMVNTIDSHGGIPQIDKNIMFHQKIIIGSSKDDFSTTIKAPYNEVPKNFHPQLTEYLPKYVAAIDLWAEFKGHNKDINISLDDIHQKKFHLLNYLY